MVTLMLLCSLHMCSCHMCSLSLTRDVAGWSVIIDNDSSWPYSLVI